MKADARTEAAVKGVLEKFAKSYSTRDMKLLLECFAPDPDVVMFCTGKDEKRIGLKEIEGQFRRDWEQTQSILMKYTWMSVSASGLLAWAAADALVHIAAGGQEMEMPIRLTMVMEKRGEQWLAVQKHVSVPAANQDDGQSMPT